MKVFSNDVENVQTYAQIIYSKPMTHSKRFSLLFHTSKEDMNPPRKHLAKYVLLLNISSATECQFYFSHISIGTGSRPNKCVITHRVHNVCINISC